MISVVRLLGLDRIVLILCVTLFSDRLHEAVQTRLMLLSKRYLSDRVGRIIEALTLTSEHILLTIVASQSCLIRGQLNTLCIGVNANGVIWCRRESDSGLDCRINVLVLEELIVLWDSDY